MEGDVAGVLRSLESVLFRIAGDAGFRLSEKGRDEPGKSWVSSDLLHFIYMWFTSFTDNCPQ